MVELKHRDQDCLSFISQPCSDMQPASGGLHGDGQRAVMSTLRALTDTGDTGQDRQGSEQSAADLRQTQKEMTEHKNPKPKMKNVYDVVQGDWSLEVRAGELGVSEQKLEWNDSGERKPTGTGRRKGCLRPRR